MTTIGKSANELIEIDHIKVKSYHSLGSHQCTVPGYTYELDSVSAHDDDTVEQ